MTGHPLEHRVDTPRVGLRVGRPSSGRPPPRRYPRGAGRRRGTNHLADESRPYTRLAATAGSRVVVSVPGPAKTQVDQPSAGWSAGTGRAGRGMRARAVRRRSVGMSSDPHMTASKPYVRLVRSAPRAAGKRITRLCAMAAATPPPARTACRRDRLGGWQLGADWGTVTEDDALARARRRRRPGVSLLDTATLRRRTQRDLIGRFLRSGRTTGLTVATKMGRRVEQRPRRTPSRTSGVDRPIPAAPRRGDPRPGAAACRRTRSCRRAVFDALDTLSPEERIPGYDRG